MFTIRRKCPISDTPCMYNKSSCRASSACVKEFASRSIEHRAEKRLNALTVCPSWEEGCVALEEILDRAKCILINRGKKHFNMLGSRNQKVDHGSQLRAISSKQVRQLLKYILCYISFRNLMCPILIAFCSCQKTNNYKHTI